MKSTAQKALIATAGTILWIIILPIVFVIYVPLIIYKYFLVFPLLKIFRGQSKFISPTDCAVTLLNYNLKRRPFLTSQNFYLDSHVPFYDIKEHFERCFLTEENYNMKYEALYLIFSSFLGYTIKTKKNYNEYSMDKHFSELFYEDILSELGRNETEKLPGLPPEEINDIISEYIFSTQKEYFEVNVSDPLWKIFVVNSRSGDEKTTIVFCSDHLVMDAYSLFHTAAVLTNSEMSYPVKSENLEVRKKVYALLCLPCIGLHKLLSVILSTELISKPQFPRSFSNFPRTYATRRLQIDSIKQIRRATGVNFSSILRSLFAGALYSYISEKKMSGNKLMDNMDCAKHCYIASSLAWPNHPIADTSARRKKLKNHFSYGIFPTEYATENTLGRISSAEREHQLYEDFYMRWVCRHLFYKCVSLSPFPLNTILVDMHLPMIRSVGLLGPTVFTSKLGNICGSRVTHILQMCVDNGWHRSAVFQSFPVAFGKDLVISINSCKQLFANREEGVDFLDNYFEREINLALEIVTTKCTAVQIDDSCAKE